jgi:hypothetical protein
MSGEPDRGTATRAESGRACPYCRFPLKEGTQTARCRACGAIHHAECWDENLGCAVVGCAAGPMAEASGRAPGAPAGTASPPPAPFQAPWPPAPSRRRSGLWMVTTLVLLALVAGGGAVAYVMQRPKHPAAAPPPQTVTAVETQTVARTPSEPPPTASSSVLPAESRAQMTGEIRDLLYQHHEDIVTGDFRGAWDLLTARKRHQNLVKYGYATWRANQATLSPYLDPTGIQVRILALDPRTGEATVDVTGMTWSKPGAACSEWSGITWVKYEDGQWLYDPGYSTTPAREAAWKSRYYELLGASC